MILVFGAIIALNLWGLAMTQRSQIWLLANDDSRKGMGKLHTDIRTASTIYVGSGDLNGFTNAGATNIQAGNAMKVYASTNTNSWVLYYYDAPPTSSTAPTGTALPPAISMLSGQPHHQRQLYFHRAGLSGQHPEQRHALPGHCHLSVIHKIAEPPNCDRARAAGGFYQINSKIAPRMRP